MFKSWVRLLPNWIGLLDTIRKNREEKRRENRVLQEGSYWCLILIEFIIELVLIMDWNIMRSGGGHADLGGISLIGCINGAREEIRQSSAGPGDSSLDPLLVF